MKIRHIGDILIFQYSRIVSKKFPKNPFERKRKSIASIQALNLYV
jgi:hypothetical protein